MKGIKQTLFPVALLLLTLSFSVPLPAVNSARDVINPAETKPSPRTQNPYGHLPLRFEINQGQTDSEVRFISRGRDHALFLTSTEAVIRLSGSSASSRAKDAVLRLRLNGANSAPRLSALDEMETKSHYFLGRDKQGWRTNLRNFGRIRYSSVYPGIDLEWHGDQDQFEHDFIIAPGADPKRIRWSITGAQQLRTDAQGALQLETETGPLRMLKPTAWQEVDGQKREIACDFIVDRRGLVGFQLGDYDRQRELVIDPVLVYSRVLGGSEADSALSVAIDQHGQAYITGTTASIDFPGASPIQAARSQGANTGRDFDAFVLKLNAAGTSVIYATWLGGAGNDAGGGIVVDSAGQAAVTGITLSADFPTKNASQEQKKGASDAFVLKLNAAGSAILYSTYFGGSGEDRSTSLASDGQGNIYLTGATDSSDFPLAGAFQTVKRGSGRDAFIAKMNSTGSSLIYSSYLGGSESEIASAIAVDGDGNAYIVGTTQSSDFPVVAAYQPTRRGTASDAFVAKIDPTGANLVWSTYLGGERAEEGRGIAVSGTGNVYLTGMTTSSDFPAVQPYQAVLAPSGGSTPTSDAFLTRFAAHGRSLDFSTYFGGNSGEVGNAVALDAAGNVYLTGSTGSRDFPLLNAVQPLWNNTNMVSSSDIINVDGFVAKFRPNGAALVYSTYLGGRRDDIGYGLAVDLVGNAYVAGATFSENFPVTSSYQDRQGEMFVAKLAINADLAIELTDETDPVMVANEAIYQVKISNQGPDEATGVRFSTALPTGMTFVSITPSQGACSSGANITCDLGNLGITSQATIMLVVRAETAGNRAIGAIVTSNTPDLNTGNNTAAQETRFSTQPSISGRVTIANGASAGEPLADVDLALTGSSTATQKSRVDGRYQFPDLTLNGNYAVTPAKDGYVFNPAQRAFNNLTADQKADFSAVACDFNLSIPSQTFPAVGGVRSVNLIAPDQRCAWTAATNFPWLKVTSATSGQGNATITFTVDPTISARAGTIKLANRVLTIRQEFQPCQPPNFNRVPVIETPNLMEQNSLIGFVVRDFNGDGRPDPAYIKPQQYLSIAVVFSRANGYDPAVEIAANAPLSSLNAGDFNKDGRPDLVARVDRGGDQSNVIVFLNNGNGGFLPPAEYPTAPGGGPIAIADLNHDGNLDLAVATNKQSGMPPPVVQGVSILLGNGSGAFSTPRNVEVAMSAAVVIAQITTGDVDGDGNVDLMTLDSLRGISVLRGNGSGDLQVVKQFNLPFTLSNAVIGPGDFNRDGKTDLAVWASGTLLVYPADGAGGFGNPFERTIAQSSTLGPMIGVEDFNLDGRDDLALLTLEGIAILLSNSNGEPGPPILYAVGKISFFIPRSGTLPIEDYNGDGRPDIFVPIVTTATLDSSPTFPSINLAILESSGSGFNAPSIRPLISNLLNVIVRGVVGISDFDGDGLTDLAVRYGSTTDFIAFEYGDGQGGFRPEPIDPSAAPNFPANATSIVGTDFNRDGRPDYAVLNASGGQFNVFLNNGNRSFTMRPAAAIGTSPRLLASSDFTGDTIPDLLLSNNGNTSKLLVGDGQGGFVERVAAIPVDLLGKSFVSGDYNGDGYTDLAVLTLQSPQGLPTFDPIITFLYGDGNGRFTNVRVFNIFFISQLLPRDLNGDGRTDLVYYTDSSRSVMVALANSDGTFGLNPGTEIVPNFVYSSISQLRIQTLVDVNGDALPDLILGRLDNNTSFLMTGKGDGSFNAPIPLSLVSGTSAVFATTLNEDGATDLLVVGANPVNMTTVLQRGGCAVAGSVVTTSAASFRGYRPALESIAAAFGTGFTDATQVAATIPLPTSLGGVRVRIRDSQGNEHFAPLFFVSPGQINYQIPAVAATGIATVTVLRSDAVVSTGVIDVTAVSPGLFAANSNGAGLAAAEALRVKTDGAQVYEPVVRFDQAQNRIVAVPIDLGGPPEEVFLILFGTGVRKAGANVKVTIGGVEAETTFAGAHPTFIGLDQVNVRLPRQLAGRGEVEVIVTANGKTSNPLNIVVK